MHKLLFIVTLIITQSRSETSLECFQHKISKLEGYVKFFFFQLVHKKNIQIFGPKVKPETEVLQQVIEFDIPFTKVIENLFIFKPNLIETPSDIFWRDKICTLALQSFKDLPQQIIFHFCSYVTNKETLGHVKGLKFGFFEEFMKYFRKSFQIIYKEIQQVKSLKFKIDLSNYNVSPKNLDQIFTKQFKEFIFIQEPWIRIQLEQFKENIEKNLVESQLALIKDKQDEIKSFENENLNLNSENYSFWIFLIKVFGTFKNKNYQFKKVQKILEKSQFNEKSYDNSHFFMHYFNYLIIESQQGKYKFKEANSDVNFFLNFKQQFSLVCLKTFQQISQQLSDKHELQNTKCEALANLLFTKLKQKIKEVNENIQNGRKLFLGHFVWDRLSFQTIYDHIKLIITQEYDRSKNNFFIIDVQRFQEKMHNKFDDVISKIVNQKQKGLYEIIKFDKQLSGSLSRLEQYILLSYTNYILISPYINIYRIFNWIGDFVQDTIEHISKKYLYDFYPDNKDSKSEMNRFDYSSYHLESIFHHASANVELREYIDLQIKKELMQQAEKRKENSEYQKMLRNLYHRKFENNIYILLMWRYPSKKDIWETVAYDTFSPGFIEIHDIPAIYNLIINKLKPKLKIKQNSKEAEIAFLSQQIIIDTQKIIQFVDLLVESLHQKYINQSKEVNQYSVIGQNSIRGYIIQYIQSQIYKEVHNYQNDFYQIPHNIQDQIKSTINILIKRAKTNVHNPEEQNRLQNFLKVYKILQKSKFTKQQPFSSQKIFEQIASSQQPFNENFQNYEDQMKDIMLYFSRKNILSKNYKNRNKTIINNISKIFQVCENVEQEKLPFEKCTEYFKDQNKCSYINAGLTFEKCKEGTIRKGRYCEFQCPENFIQDKYDFKNCLFSKVIYVGEENCPIYFMKYQGFCFPTCPDNYETKDNYCIKPKGHKYKKFYHDGFLKKAVSQ